MIVCGSFNYDLWSPRFFAKFKKYLVKKLFG